MRGVFVDLEPSGKVAWLWDETSREKGVPPLVSFHIQKKGRRSEITLIHAGFRTSKTAAALKERFRAGWEDCLAKLKLHLECGKTCKEDRLTFSDLELLSKKGRR